MIDRLNPQELRDRLFAEKFWSKKEFGQHFLIDEEVLTAVVKTAELEDSDTVIEVGPGMGVLSEQLLPRVKKVIAFEMDTQMQKILHTDFPNLTVVPGDVLQTAPPIVNELSRYKVVANIPYQITTPLLKLFLEGGVQVLPERLVWLVQKEVGERLAAGPRETGRGYLSVLLQYYADVSYVQTVQRTAFWPIPGVDSAIILVKVKTNRAIEAGRERAFLKYVKAGFAAPRKQLKNVLAGIRGVETTEVAKQFKELGIVDNARAQELSEDEWNVLFTHGV